MTAPLPSPRSRSSSTTSSTAPLPSFEEYVPPRPAITGGQQNLSVKVEGLGKDVQLVVDAAHGCGGVTWPAGEVMSRYLVYRHSLEPDRLKEKKILELGSGTGLVGLVTAMLEPSSEIWITDQAPLLELMETNTRLNLGEDHDSVHVTEFNWGESVSSDIPIEDIEVVLAADCVYFEPAFPLLVQTLCDVAPLGKTIEILFSYNKRRKADKKFFAMLKKHFTNAFVEDDKPGERERYGRQG
ncbi:hypothetical protein I350_01019, partial [Cryptococcus amylolentus CBS 6273]